MPVHSLPVLDLSRCVGCGLCLTVCPKQSFAIKGGKAVVSGRCIGCGHCQAICPAQAVSVPGLDGWAEGYATFSAPEAWVAPGDFDVGGLAALMRSRRSCRNYMDKPVGRELLEDLVRMGVTAPSGTNSQKWTFTLLPDREAVQALGGLVAAFFRKLNRKAERRWLRLGLKLVGQPGLDWYYKEYYQSVSQALADWDRDLTDRLFHGATAAIVVGSAPGASCPREDALLATQNMLLAAHAMGLGSCLIGYAVAAMQKAPAIKRALGMAKGEIAYAVIALGWPDEKWARPALRRMPLLRTYPETR